MKKMIAPICLMILLSSVQYARADRASCITAAENKFKDCMKNAGADAAIGGALGCAGGALAGAPAGGIGALPGCFVGGVFGVGAGGLPAAYHCGTQVVDDINKCPEE